MATFLICNQEMDIDLFQVDVSRNRITLDNSPGSDLLERRLEMMTVRVTLLMLWSSNLGWASREIRSTYTMAGVSYLPWMLGALEECLGEGYWLSFNQRLPISFELGDHLFGILN